MTKRATLLPVPAPGDCRGPGAVPRVPMLAGLLVFLCVTGGAVGFASNEDVEAQQAARRVGTSW